ncbi:hypothetical protein GE061_007877 [Apolygus lucorum]|uniref:PiggyBac transposable element-derived protein domain-containing protein n=1 Tax=Apolygus lucorum TaxID=248454 RepID=A0A8S9WM12_APOLU|nr:hypothetical protein GE061_007877 [Apolygus lucorum]
MIYFLAAQPCQIQPEAAAVDCGLPQDELVDSHCEEDQCSSDEGEPVIDTVFSVVDQPGCVNLMSASSGVVVREPADADSPDGYSWTSEDVTSQEIPFPWKPGLQCPMYPATPYDFFRCVIGKRFYMIFINQVNKCAFEMGVETKTPSRKKKPKSKTLVSQWKTLSEDQLEIWLAILIQMGGIQNPSFTHYWSSEIMHKSSFFSEVAMTKDRWLGIMQTLHFMGRPSGSEKTEPFFKAGPLVTCFNEQMKKLYVPDRELCVEEPVILWKGRLVPWGFLKDKKDATKLHTVSEPGGLILRFYTDKMDISDESAASKVVRRVLADFMDKGHSIFMARCYTGVDLCHELLSRQVHTTGPLLPTRKNIPERILTSNPQPENVVYTRSNHGVVVMKFTDNIDQYLFVSSEFNPFLLKSTYKSFSKLKPEAITAYDKFISGISNSYCHLSDYGAVLQHTTSHVRITIHLIEIAVYNAFVLYKKYSTNCLDFAAFRADLVRRLAGLKKSFKK